MEVLKVSANSKPSSVAGAIAASLRNSISENIDRIGVEVQAIGAGAVNQAIKAVAITRGYVAPNGIDLIVIPAFSEVNIDGELRTAIKLIIEPR